jgi:hypothetical protein
MGECGGVFGETEEDQQASHGTADPSSYNESHHTLFLYAYVVWEGQRDRI